MTLEEFPKADIEERGLLELSKAAKWHQKKYSNQPMRTYMFTCEGVCVYTFRGTVKELKAIDRFLSTQRKKEKK